MEDEYSWKPNHKNAPGFFSLDRIDLSLGMFSVFVTGCFWILIIKSSSIKNIIYYRDAVNLQAPLFFRKIDPLFDPFQIAFSQPAQQRVPPFILHRVIIRVLAYLFGGSITIASSLTVFALAFVYPIILRHTLIIFHINTNPTFAALVSIIFPMRFVFNRAVPLPDTLYFCLVCLAFIFFKTDCFGPLIISTFAASMTFSTGILLFPAFAIAYHKLKREREFIYCISIGATIFLFLYQSIPDWRSYVDPWNFQYSEKVILPTLRKFDSIGYIQPLKVILTIWIALLFGGVSLALSSGPIGYYILCCLFFFLSIDVEDVARVASVPLIFSVYGALGPLFKKTRFVWVVCIVFPIIFFTLIYSAPRQFKDPTTDFEIWEEKL